ncbi:hypothetical protein PFISCL1PPCAC_12567, partial [Pristionchus fissidentatus]
QLRFAKLDVETSNGCMKDALILTEGYCSAFMFHMCGNAKDSHNIVRDYSSTSRFLVLTWKTDENIEQSGWELWHKFEYEDRRCGFATHDLEGVIAFPDDDTDYEPDMECHWEISVPAGYRMLLHFNRMDIEQTETCSNDYLQIRDVQETLLRKNGALTTGTSESSHTYCRSSAPEDLILGNSITVQFVSNENRRVGRGFE